MVNVYDSEGHAVSFENTAVVYDALGRAVAANGQQFLYGPNGQKLAVMNGQAVVRADIPLPGGGVAAYWPSGLSYYSHADWLGSSRLDSTPSRALYRSNAIAPYGEAYSANAASYFTGMAQDINSSQPGGSLDFPFREYNPVQSRWWTPDPVGLAAVDPNDPQSWNRYAYACDPMSYLDPTGTTTCTVNVQVDNAAGLSAGDVQAIENRVNQIFGATATSAGNTTQVAFGGGGSYSLQLSDLTNLMGLVGQVFDPQDPSEPATVFVKNIQQSHPAASFALAAGAVSAHELVHRIAGIPDQPYLVVTPNSVSFDPNLMTVDSAIGFGIGAEVASDNQASSPSAFSRISQQQANTLYRECLKLQPPKIKKPSGGWGFGGGWRYSQIWGCGSEGCGPVGGAWWYDNGGIIPPGLVSPFVF